MESILVLIYLIVIVLLIREAISYMLKTNQILESLKNIEDLLKKGGNTGERKS